MDIVAKECICLILSLCQAHKDEAAILPVETAEQDRFRRALLYIHKNFRRNLTVAEVAAEVYLVPNYFSSYFEKKWVCPAADILINCVWILLMNISLIQLI